MRKAVINRWCRKFGFEVHGTGYMQSLEKTSFKEDAFLKQAEITGGKADVIFDIGANSGDISLRYHTLFAASSIFSFEPFPQIFKTLQQRTDQYNRIKVFQKAIGSTPGKSVFYVNHNVDTNSLLEPRKAGLSSDKQVANKEKIEVDVITIDEFCEANAIKKIDILKMDIQGGELAALQGAKKMLASKSINMIYTEAYFRKQYVDQPLLHSISAYLEGYGYFLQDIYNPIYGNGSIAWCDAIYLPG